MRDDVEQDRYEAPELRVLGSVEELTLGAVDGDFLDADFAVETPKSDITFS